VQEVRREWAWSIEIGIERSVSGDRFREMRRETGIVKYGIARCGGCAFRPGVVLGG
jgi:hypothetical protein